jgi:ATP-dependent Clp protease ATP-binding subunit ClpA
MSRAILVAQKYGHKRIGTEHILHGLSEEENSKAFNILANLKIKTINICSAIEKLSPVNDAAIPTHGPKLPQTRRAKKSLRMPSKNLEGVSPKLSELNKYY